MFLNKNFHRPQHKCLVISKINEPVIYKHLLTLCMQLPILSFFQSLSIHPFISNFQPDIIMLKIFLCSMCMGFCWLAISDRGEGEKFCRGGGAAVMFPASGGTQGDVELSFWKDGGRGKPFSSPSKSNFCPAASDNTEKVQCCRKHG